MASNGIFQHIDEYFIFCRPFPLSHWWFRTFMTMNRKSKFNRRLTMKHRHQMDFLTKKKIHIKVEQNNKLLKVANFSAKKRPVYKLFTHIANQDSPENRQTIYGSAPNCLLYTYNRKNFAARGVQEPIWPKNCIFGVVKNWKFCKFCDFWPHRNFDIQFFAVYSCSPFNLELETVGSI